MKQILFLLSFVIFCDNNYAQSQLWGMSKYGGSSYGAGAIIRTDSVGNNGTFEHEFYRTLASSPKENTLTQLPNGKIYGLTNGGGFNSKGLLFQYEEDKNMIIPKVHFGGGNGEYPEGSLLYATDGNLYGLCQGGSGNNGMLFQYNPITEIYTVKVYFAGTSNGKTPKGSLIQANDGKLYGVTYDGGTNNKGVLFSYDPVTSTYTKKHDFAGGAWNDGVNPLSSLMQASNGKIYGFNSYDVFNNNDFIFEYNPISNTVIGKYYFNYLSSPIGYDPIGTLTESNGKLYGVTSSGAANSFGALFEYNFVTNTTTKKNDFDGINFGSSPNGSLMKDSNGDLYGMTKLGGINNLGTLFKFNISSGTVVKKLDFDGAVKGSMPYGSLMNTVTGKIYGMTNRGGKRGAGLLFAYYDLTASYSKMLDFDDAPDGILPNGSLMRASNGKIYGTAEAGGLKRTGVIFEYDPLTHKYTKKIDLDTLTTGYLPTGYLVEAPNGKLYGMTSAGGVSNFGVLFEYDPVSNVFTKKVDFAGISNGKQPVGSLTLASDGKIYGTAYTSGVNNAGVLFQFDPATGIYVKKQDFTTSTSSGNGPVGALVEALDGKLYGVTIGGGIYGNGIIYQYDPGSNILTKKFDFQASVSGNLLTGSLILADNGKLYGTTAYSPAGNGFLFQYDPATSACVLKINYKSGSGVQGIGTTACLMQASNHKIYSKPVSGEMFEYDLVANTSNQIFDFGFQATSSTYLAFYNLIEIEASISSPSLSPNACIDNTFNVPFLISGTYNTGNIFTAQLSDAAGSFAGAVSIGTLSSISAGTITAAIPNTTTLGAGYRIRVVSSSPIIIGGDNGSNIAVNATPTITVNSGAICNGQSFTMTPSGASTYVFSEGSSVVSPTATTTYTVIGTAVNSCTNSVISSVTVNALPTLTISTSSVTTTCFNSAVGFSVATIENVLWSGPGPINPAPTVYNPTVTTSGIYTVTVTDANSCTNMGTVAVYSNTIAPTFALTPSMLTVCAGSSVSISANATPTAVTYLWNNAATTQSIVVTPTVTSVYTATVTDNTNGCYSSQTTTVNVYALPILTITGTNTVCLGTSTSFAVNGGLAYTWSTGQASSIIYVNPTVTTNYSVSGTDMNGCTNTATVSLTIDNACADAWPGDANSDGTADNLDVLELGLHYTQTGAPRASVSNTWQSYFSNNWAGTITNGKNLNHSDCNGDGTINDDDTLAIFNNYGLTHTFKPAQTNTVNPQLSIVPDQTVVTKGNWGAASVYLGDATTTINNINGVAFTVDFDNTLIEPNSIWIEYINSFIDASQNLHFRKLDFANSKLYTATTHTLSNNVNGFGKIAILHYQILSSLTTDQVLNVGLSQANQSSTSGAITSLTSGTGTLMAIGASVGVKESALIGGLMISPNPTNGIININSTNDLQSIEVTTIAGQVLLKQTCSDKTHQLQLQNFSDGVYFVKVYFNNGSVVVRKVVKQ